jgi:hypothetical protein
MRPSPLAASAFNLAMAEKSAVNEVTVSFTADEPGVVVLLLDGVFDELLHAAASTNAPIAITTVAVRMRVTCMISPCVHRLGGGSAGGIPRVI